MENEFDFKSIGKQMPYRTPEDFFEKMQKQVTEHAQGEKPRKQPRMKLVVATAFAVAAMLLGLVFFPTTQPEAEQLSAGDLLVSTDLTYSYSDAMDSYIEEMPDEELAEWVEFSDNDIFIN